MRRTREEYIAGLEYKLADIEEALHAAVSMKKWTNVIKYAEQAMTAEAKLFDAMHEGRKRLRRIPWLQGHQGRTAGSVFGRGGKWIR